MRSRHKILFLFLITISVNAQQFELIGAPGANGGVNTITINPDNPSVVCAAHHFGLYKSEDGGQSAKAVNTEFYSWYVNALKVFKENKTIVLGEYYTGYHKSTDGGDNWTIINTDKNARKVIRINPLNKEFYYIKKNYNEIWRSKDNGDSWYKFATFDNEIVSFDIVPVDTSILYVATNNQLYKTTNAGKDWVKKVPLPDTWRMNINPLNANVLYIQTGGLLQKSIDGGESIFAVLYPQVQTFKLSTADTSVLYASILMDDVGVKRGNYKSTDGGLTWQELKIGMDNSPTSLPQPMLEIEINPQNGDEVYVGIGEMGVFKTTDGGNSWIHTNLTYMEASYLSADKDNPDEIVIGNRGWGIMKTTDGGKNWIYPYFDIAPKQIHTVEQCFNFDPLDRKKGFLAGSNYLYNTVDGGSSWQLDKQFDKEVSTVHYHKYLPDTVFAGLVGESYISTDRGHSWQQYSGVIPNTVRYVKTDPNFLYAYGLVITDANNYFVAEKSTDLGKTWIQINNGLLRAPESGLLNAISSLEPDINNPDIAYCGQQHGLSKTTNGGENWFQIDSSLKLLEQPWLGFPTILLDPNKSGRIYVGIRGSGVVFTDQFTKGGLYLTEDDCKTWRRVFTGSVVGIYSDEGNPRRVFINTFQGVFRFLDTLTVTDIKDIPNNLPESFLLQQNYPNPFNPSTTISYQIPSNNFVTLKVYDVLGNEVATLVNEWKEAGSYSLQFSTSGKLLASGMYFYTLTAGKFTDTKKFILLK
ncbi:MAG: T9SS type A sorting domain-containing protein [Ignavibacteriaceae bacterium]|jgi:photosystem II stability/assembly factor-like uncharacterized protein